MTLAENALTGVAIGAAMMGKRPVLSFHRVEFALLAMEQIANNAAKSHYISRGKHTVPLVLRLIVGRGWGQGPEHSQSLEAMFAMIPGLKVIMPTFPADAKGLIIAAIEDNNPVIIIEHRWCHYIQGDVPTGYYTSDLEAPKEIIKGEDITIIASSFMTIEAIEAAESLNELGYTASVFDLRVLRPLKLDTIYKLSGSTDTNIIRWTTKRLKDALLNLEETYLQNDMKFQHKIENNLLYVHKTQSNSQNKNMIPKVNKNKSNKYNPKA